MRSSLAMLRHGSEPRRATIFTFSLIVLGAGYYGWLQLPDSSSLYLSLQVVAGALLLLGGGALLAGTVGSLAGSPGWLSRKRLVRQAPKGIVVLIAAGVLYWFSGWLQDVVAQRMYMLSSWLSYHLNRPVPVPPFQAAWQLLFLFMYFALLPVLAIRVLAWWLHYRSAGDSDGRDAIPLNNSSAKGHAGRRNFFLFWAVAVALAVVFDWLPWLLIWWVPNVRYDWAEVVSAATRLGVAGLAFTFGLVIQWSWYLGARTATPVPLTEPSLPKSSAE